MCWYGDFQFTGCGHRTNTTRRHYRCSKPSVCNAASSEHWFYHEGECPTCLQGACFPFFEPTEETAYEADHPLILLECRDYAASILDWSITWLVANPLVRELIEPSLSSSVEVQAAIDHLILRTYYVQESCVECGTSTFDTNTCNTCPGMLARAEKTADPITRFRLEVLRNVYGTYYLPEVQTGHYQDLMTQIRKDNDVIPLFPEDANLLVHQTPILSAVLSPAAIKWRQDTCAALMVSLSNELGVASHDASYAPYRALSKQVLEVATWILASDVGLEDHVLETVMRFLAPMLLHPRDPARPPSWEPFYSTSLDFGLYHTVLMAYMGLSGPSDRMKRITVVLKHALDTTKAEHKAAMDRLSYTKEDFLIPRVRLYSTPLPGPPDSDWTCAVCMGTGEPEDVLIQLNQCRHVFHELCFFEGAFAAEEGTRLCHMCRQPWDGMEEDLPHLWSGQQDKVWPRYGL
jgi:hypothetical protein